MGVQVTTTTKRTKDRLTLDQRLRLHKKIQPIFAWLHCWPSWIFVVLPVVAILPICGTDRHSQSSWPYLPIAAYIVFMVIAINLERLWRANITKLSAYDNITSVAPLLDYADVTFLSLHNRSAKAMPESEAMVLPYLPGLLARMPAGDGPALTPSQRSALIRLICSPLYERHFNLPGLREKTEAIIER